MKAGALLLGAVLLLAAPFLPAQSAEAPVLREFIVDRSDSPWLGYTGSAAEERAGYSIAAKALDPGWETPPGLSSFALDGKPFLAIDRKARRVYVEETFFGDLERPDSGRLEAGDDLPIGIAKDSRLRENPEFLIAFLIQAQIVRTYWHLEARLRLESLEEEGGFLRARFSGSHIYFTNERNEAPLDFAIAINLSTGEMRLLGR